ncbi:hypothetical protein GW742_25015 [Citrobacter freundii]|nr:hypothetical protein [Citrobacter freundii]MBC6509568.1 hypothetical protein [Citrobacter freundii]
MRCCQPVTVVSCRYHPGCGCVRHAPVWFWLVQIWLLLPWWLTFTGMTFGGDLTGFFYPEQALQIAALFCGVPVFLMLFVFPVRGHLLLLTQLAFVLLWSGALGEMLLMMWALLSCPPSREKWFEGLVCVHLGVMFLLTFSPRLWLCFFPHFLSHEPPGKAEGKYRQTEGRTE